MVYEAKIELIILTLGSQASGVPADGGNPGLKWKQGRNLPEALILTVLGGCVPPKRLCEIHALGVWREGSKWAANYFS